MKKCFSENQIISKLRQAIIIGAVGLFLTGCLRRSDDQWENELLSPSGHYKVSVSRNNDKSDKTKWLCLKIHIKNSAEKEVDVIQTSASDTMKWALGWMKDKDVVVLYSSDIGTYGYIITKDEKLEKVETGDSIAERGRDLYEKKYKR
ncbi:MAG: hypothetical protein ABFR90_09530 [Planctomycetota bacterium]